MLAAMHDKKEVVSSQGSTTMQLDNIGETLKSTFPLEIGSMADMLVRMDEATQDPSVASYAAGKDDTFPRFYRNKFDLRVDVYGAVVEGTKEYAEGYRFFDSHGSFYRDDGTSGNDTDAYDLVNAIDADALPAFAPPTSVLNWVHPKHRTSASFFLAMIPGESVLSKGGVYLNRMGFVVTINHNGPSTAARIVRDTLGYLYHPSCRRYEQVDSMCDLVYQVINVDLFYSARWSTDTVSDAEPENDSPEMFDPVVENKQALIEDFYRAVIRARSLADRAGIDFRFLVNDGMKIDNDQVGTSRK